MSDFSTILIEDSRIANITEKETFAVMSGASQCTYQAFNATSTSSSSIVFNCQIPSENVASFDTVNCNSNVYFKCRK